MQWRQTEAILDEVVRCKDLERLKKLLSKGEIWVESSIWIFKQLTLGNADVLEAGLRQLSSTQGKHKRTISRDMAMVLAYYAQQWNTRTQIFRRILDNWRLVMSYHPHEQGIYDILNAVSNACHSSLDPLRLLASAIQTHYKKQSVMCLNKAMVLRASRGDLRGVQYFLEIPGVDIHYEDEDALLSAITHGSIHYPLIQYLLHKGADPCVRRTGGPILKFCTEFCSGQILLLMLDYCPTDFKVTLSSSNCTEENLSLLLNLNRLIFDRPNRIQQRSYARLLALHFPENQLSYLSVKEQSQMKEYITFMSHLGLLGRQVEILSATGNKGNAKCTTVLSLAQWCRRAIVRSNGRLLSHSTYDLEDKTNLNTSNARMIVYHPERIDVLSILEYWTSHPLLHQDILCTWYAKEWEDNMMYIDRRERHFDLPLWIK